MDQLQRLLPEPDFFDDGVGIGGPEEGLGVMVGLDEVSVDGGLEIDDALGLATRRERAESDRAPAIGGSLAESHRFARSLMLRP
jgi:hypothetical protein